MPLGTLCTQRHTPSLVPPPLPCTHTHKAAHLMQAMKQACGLLAHADCSFQCDPGGLCRERACPRRAPLPAERSGVPPPAPRPCARLCSRPSPRAVRLFRRCASLDPPPAGPSGPPDPRGEASDARRVPPPAPSAPPCGGAPASPPGVPTSAGPAPAATSLCAGSPGASPGVGPINEDAGGARYSSATVTAGGAPAPVPAAGGAPAPPAPTPPRPAPRGENSDLLPGAPPSPDPCPSAGCGPPLSAGSTAPAMAGGGAPAYM